MISRSVTVTTTRAVVFTASPNWRTVLLHVLGNGIVYLGGSDVTSSNGMPTEKGAVPIEIAIPANETVYAVVASSTEDLRILEPIG